MVQPLILAIFAIGALLLTACGGEGAGGTPQETPAAPTCDVIAFPDVVLDYPLNLSTGVPDTFDVILASVGSPTIALQAAGGSRGAPLQQTQLPTELPTPNAGLQATGAYSSGPLKPDTVYTVLVQGEACDGTMPFNAVSSFTTQ